MSKMTLTQARQAVGWNQTQLAKAANAGVSTINELEKSDGDANPGYKLVMRIVRALQSRGLDVVAEDIFATHDESSDEQQALPGIKQPATERRNGADRRARESEVAS